MSNKILIENMDNFITENMDESAQLKYITQIRKMALMILDKGLTISNVDILLEFNTLINDTKNAGVMWHKTQKLDYFDIIDGRVNGQITFRATSNFNSYYYGKELVTYLQLVNKQGIVIAEKKANVLRFTQTEQDETIHYDEAVGDLEIVYAISTVETHDKRSMAENLEFKIKKDEPPEEEGLPRTDFLAKIGGVLAGSIAIALLLPKRIGN